MQCEGTDTKPLKEYCSGVFQLEGSRDGVTPTARSHGRQQRVGVTDALIQQLGSSSFDDRCSGTMGSLFEIMLALFSPFCLGEC